MKVGDVRIERAPPGGVYLLLERRPGVRTNGVESETHWSCLVLVAGIPGERAGTLTEASERWFVNCTNPAP